MNNDKASKSWTLVDTKAFSVALSLVGITYSELLIIIYSSWAETSEITVPFNYLNTKKSNILFRTGSKNYGGQNIISYNYSNNTIALTSCTHVSQNDQYDTQDTNATLTVYYR